MDKNVLLIILLLGWLYFATERSKFFLHVLQLESYEERRYIKWLIKGRKLFSDKYKKTLLLLSMVTCIYGIFVYALDSSNIIVVLRIIYYLIWTICLLMFSSIEVEELEESLAFINRAKRLFVANGILNFLLALLVLILYRQYIGFSLIYFPMVLYLYFLLYIFQPYIIYLSSLIIKPLENSINKYYYQKAQKKINSMGTLQVVGITGSFGKTSTRLITEAILKQRYRILSTNENCNTSMDLSKLINEELDEKHQVFIVEMGARRMGDIKDLAKLIKPNIGVITSIGPAHLETFKNIDSIMKTKYELIEELQPEGVAIFNYDNTYIRKLADKTFKEKILFGMKDIEKLDLYADNVEISEEGSTFTIKDKKGNSIDFKTQLVGKYNIYNILAGACVAKALGLDLEEIKRAIEINRIVKGKDY